MSKIVSIKDIKFDPKNANKGTARGRAMLETSLQKYGAGRSILIDKNNVIISGNKTTEVAGGIGMENVRIIETNGTEIIAVKRTDLDLNTDREAKELAIADNRVGEIDLEWDTEAIAQLQIDGTDLIGFFSQEEIDKLTLSIPSENKTIDEDSMTDTKNECPKCGFKW